MICRLNMARWGLSALTAIVSLLGGVVWLALGSTVSGLLWVGISIGWLVASIAQLRTPDKTEPFPISRLLRRISRLILFWS